MVLMESLSLPLLTKVVGFELKDFNGKTFSLENFSKEKILVIVFMCNHCPYVQAVWGRLVALQEKYLASGVSFVGINSNVGNPDYAEETVLKMEEYSKKYRMNFPYLVDDSQEVAKKFKAQCTPDIYVFDEQRLLRYHGRIDDNWKNEVGVQSHDLDEAVSLLLSGKTIEGIQHPSMGCSIKWK